MVSSTTEVSSTFPALAYASRGQKYAKISIAAGVTDGPLVPAVTGMKIRVLALAATQTADGAATMEFNSASTPLTGEIASVTQTSLVMPFSPAGWFETAAGEALTLTTAAIGVYGCLVYDEVAI